LIHPVVSHAAVLAAFRPLAPGPEEPGRSATALAALLRDEPAVVAVSVGLPDGTLLRMQRIEGGTVGGGAAPAASAYVVTARAPGHPTTLRFLDIEGETTSVRELREPWRDPRAQQWYLQAHRPGVQVSPLYVLDAAGVPGISISTTMPGGAVLSLDLTLSAIGGFLASARPTPGSLPVLFTEDGILLGHPEPGRAMRSAAVASAPGGWTTLGESGDPALERLWNAYATAALAPGGTSQVTIDGREMLVHLSSVHQLVAPSLRIGIVAPVDDFTGPVLGAIRRGLGYSAAAFLLGFLGILVVAVRVERPLGRLAVEAETIRRLELAAPVAVRSHITEVERLAEQMGAMKGALRVFGAYVPRDLVRKLMAERAAAELGGERRAITVMFSDIEAFSAVAERLARRS
jgi:adenylate cyclase